MKFVIPGPVAPVALLFLLCPPAPVAAQGLDAVAIEAWGARFVSGQIALEQGGGGGIGLVLGLGTVDWLGIGVELVQLRSRAERDGIACLQFRPLRTQCEPDRLDEEVMVRSLRFAAVPSMELSTAFRASGGVGFSMSEVRAVSRGMDTNKPGDLHVPPAAHLGAFLRLGLAWTPIWYFPLDIVVAGTSHWVLFDGCDAEIFYAPFCGAEHVLEFRAGVTYRIEL